MDLIDTSRAAELLGITPRTLSNWRGQRRGPSFVRLGRAIRYRRSDVEKFIRESVVAV